MTCFVFTPFFTKQYEINMLFLLITKLRGTLKAPPNYEFFNLQAQLTFSYSTTIYNSNPASYLVKTVFNNFTNCASVPSAFLRTQKPGAVTDSYQS